MAARNFFTPETPLVGTVFPRQVPTRTTTHYESTLFSSNQLGISHAKEEAFSGPPHGGLIAKSTQSIIIIMRIARYTYPAFRSPFSTSGSSARSPWSGLESEIDRLFETALGSLGDATSATRFPVDLYEDKDNTYVRAELPGVSRNDVNVEMVEDYLTISATRKTPADQEGGNGEQSFSFSRSVTVPEQVQSDKVSAHYENGVLTVTLPKREEAKPKKVTVSIK
jgi:HSP20 family protein